MDCIKHCDWKTIDFGDIFDSSYLYHFKKDSQVKYLILASRITYISKILHL